MLFERGDLVMRTLQIKRVKAGWLDPVGHAEGSLIYRWNMAEDTPIPTIRLLPRADLAAALPASTRRISHDERARMIESRRDGVRRRFARPGW